MLDQATLKEWVHYEPETGVFIKLKTGSHPLGHGSSWQAKVGKPTGSVNAGYVEITVDAKRYRAHRLAWLYMTGEWPKHMIDHINLDGTDNRWLNLRAATHSQNLANVDYKRGVSGVRGVHRQGKKWGAMIIEWDSEGKRHRRYARFDTVEEAAAYRLTMAKQHWGEFYRV